MDFRVNSDISKWTGFTGPSQDYYDAKQRFEEILSTKLNSQTGEEGIKEASEKRTMPVTSMPVQNLQNRSEWLMDRNLEGLQDSVINTADVTRKSTITAEELNERLKNTKLEGLGNAFKKAEETYGVNSLFLLGLAIHESDYGKSRIAKDKNNLFGFKAYDSSPYKSAQAFGSFAEGIDTVAKYLSENYLSADGKYFNGFSIRDIGKRYATDPQWAYGIEKRIRALLGL